MSARRTVGLICALLWVHATDAGCARPPAPARVEAARAASIPARPTPTEPAAKLERVVLEGRLCWEEAPPSGIYVQAEQQLHVSPARSLTLAIVDGCVGSDHAPLSMGTDGSIALGGRLHATGDRYWTELVLDHGELGVRAAHSRLPEHTKEVGPTTPLVRVEPLDANDHAARLALLVHAHSAVRAAAQERLLPEQNDPATCAALRAQIGATYAPSQERDALAQLSQDLRGACLLTLLRSMLGDTRALAEILRAQRQPLAVHDRAALFFALLDRHLTLGPLRNDDGQLEHAAHSLIPPHPRICAAYRPAAVNPPEAPPTCVSEDEARALVADLDARLERVASNPRAADLVLRLLMGFLGPEGVATHLLTRGPERCAARALALRAIADSVAYLQPEDVVRTFEPALSDAACAAARERATVLLAARLQAVDAPEGAWAMLLKHARPASRQPALRDELSAQLTQREGCLPHWAGRNAHGEALMQLLGIRRCL